METSLQKIIAAIVGVMILFIIPVYIAFEKADDISYSLVLKLTQNFVDNVREKGYISPEMYNDFVSGLYATNNSYDVEIEHVKKRMDPVVYIYAKKEDGTRGSLLHTLDYDKYTDGKGNILDSITLQQNIYTDNNSNIEVYDPIIEYNPSYAGGRTEDPNDPDRMTDYEYFNDFKSGMTDYEFYKEYIQQYKEHGKIVLSKGTIYADVRYLRGSAFDELVYIPAIIENIPGKIQILNRQGNENTTLDYETYISSYDARKSLTLSDGTTGMFFTGPQYNDSNSKIVVQRAFMEPKSKSFSANEGEAFYNTYKSQYEDSSTSRIIVNEGGVYADTRYLSNSELIRGVDKKSRINIIGGSITIKNESLKENGASNLEYDTYINDYDNSKELVEYEGIIYTDENSDIEIQQQAMWTSDKEYEQLSSEEKIAAKEMYDTYISKFTNDAVVFDKGEIYSEQNSPKYNRLTDTLATITVSGNLYVKSPTGWEPKEINFNDYIQSLLNMNDNDEITVDNGGYFENGKDNINISHTEGKIIDNENAEFVIDYNKYIADILNDDINVIKVSRIATYTESDEILLEAKTTDDKSILFEIDDYINGGQITIDDQQYNVSDMTITYLELPVKNESGITTPISFFDTDAINSYIAEYENSGKIQYTAPAKEYNKVDLVYDTEKLEIKNNDNTLYIFEEYMNQTLYSSYYNEYVNNGYINVVSTKFKKSDINIQLDDIVIKYDNNTKIIENADSNLVNYAKQYYNDRRIVITEANYATLNDNLKIIHPEINVYEDGKIETGTPIHTFTDNDYYKFYEEYEEKGTITYDPARIYGTNDVIVDRKYIEIVPEDTSINPIRIYDNDKNYQKYEEEYLSSYKITLSQPEWYYKTDLTVRHASISITPNGSSAPVFELYEKNSNDINNGLVSKGLFDKYSEEYNNNKSVTIVYEENDVRVDRKYLEISELSDRNSIGAVMEVHTVYDNSNSPDYDKCFKEYKESYKVTFEGARQYVKGQILVTEPSVTVYDLTTGDVIEKYEGDYDLIGNEIYKIYEERAEEYDDTHQLIGKTVTYNNTNSFIEIGHKLNEEVITDRQIIEKLFSGTSITKSQFLMDCLLGNGDLYETLSYINDNSYSMNEGDQIVVRVRNSNQTVASVFYSLFTANVGNEEIPKIYVNYGGTIKNSGKTILSEINGSIESDVGRIFKCENEVQEITLAPGKYEIQCWGASGGGYKANDKSTTGGKGAYAKGVFEFDNETTLYVYVGGEGSLYSDDNTENGGYNGGGNSYNGYGGGGATDVRLKKGELDDEVSLFTRLVTAAGGGGSSKQHDEFVLFGSGGHAGDNIRGKNGKYLYNSTKKYFGMGADAYGNTDLVTLVAEEENISISTEVNGSFGKGGSVDFDGAGAGGSGWYGGTAAYFEYAGGGGGVSSVYGDSVSKIHYNFSIHKDKMLEIQDIFDIDKREFVGINYISSEFKDGESEMPNPLPYNGSEYITGNIGNGYAIIKKID